MRECLCSAFGGPSGVTGAARTRACLAHGTVFVGKRKNSLSD